MATLIDSPTNIQAAGTPPKQIEEFVGLVNSNTAAVSIARMRSPGGWKRPGQTAALDQYTVVLKGALHLDLRGAEMGVKAGQAVTVHAGEWVPHSTPSPEGAEYIAVCLPAFSTGTVRGDERDPPATTRTR